MRTLAFALATAAAVLAACGGGGSSKQSTGSCTPGTTASVTITSSGYSPTNTCVLPGGSVSFANHDTAPHTVNATTAGAGCAGLNLGSIDGNSSKTSGTLPTAMACSFSDGTSNPAFAGTVYVQSAPATGPGY